MFSLFNQQQTFENKINILSKYGFILLFCSSLIIFFVVFKQHGLEIQNDSTSYIRGALNLKAGLGYTHANIPINHYPVGLSYVYYSLMKLFPASVFTVALYLNMALLIAIGIVFKQIMQEVGIAHPIQLAGFIIFYLSPPVITMGAQLLTELPSTLIVMSSTLLMFRLNKKTNVWFYVLLIGIMLGIGILIRFAMIGIIAGFATFQLWAYRNSLKRALFHSALVCLPGIVIIFSYSSYVRWRYHNPSVDRKLIWHPISAQKLIQFLKTPITWLVQYQYNPIAQTIVLGTLALIIVALLWQTTNKKIPQIATRFNHLKENKHAVAMITISLVYCLFITASISLFDGATPVNTRILSPIAVYFYLGITLWLNRIYSISSTKNRSALWCFILAIIIAWPAKTILWQRYKYPQSFNKPYWQNEARFVVNDSATKWVKPHCTIYTNAYPFWQLCNNRSIKKLPDLVYEVQKKVNTHYIDDMVAIRNEITYQNAALFFFYTMPSHSNKTKKMFIDTFFANPTLFKLRYFNKGVFIQANMPPKDSK
jgi:hypothetical protein